MARPSGACINTLFGVFMETIRLSRLKPRLLKIKTANTYVEVESLCEAQGIQFLCPKCYLDNNGAAGTHLVCCWFRNREVPDNVPPGPGRWTPHGDSIDNLTFVPGEPPMAVSVLLNNACGWHGYITDGNVLV